MGNSRYRSAYDVLCSVVIIVKVFRNGLKSVLNAQMSWISLTVGSMQSFW
jgi:hypothetical protein